MQDLISLLCGALVALLVLLVSYWVVVFYTDMGGATATGATGTGGGQRGAGTREGFGGQAPPRCGTEPAPRRAALEEGSWMVTEGDVAPLPAYLRPDETPTRFVDAGEDGLGPEGPTIRGRRPFSISVPDHSPLEN